MQAIVVDGVPVHVIGVSDSKFDGLGKVSNFVPSDNEFSKERFMIYKDFYPKILFGTLIELLNVIAPPVIVNVLIGLSSRYGVTLVL